MDREIREEGVIRSQPHLLAAGHSAGGRGHPLAAGGGAALLPRVMLLLHQFPLSSLVSLSKLLAIARLLPSPWLWILSRGRDPESRATDRV
jgi:hypothetical protein